MGIIGPASEHYLSFNDRNEDAKMDHNGYNSIVEQIKLRVSVDIVEKTHPMLKSRIGLAPS